MQNNIELKRLLNQYLGDSTVNDALRVPPGQVMRVRNVSHAKQAQQLKLASATVQAGGAGKGKPGGGAALFSKTQ
jgi:hypothetical protein